MRSNTLNQKSKLLTCANRSNGAAIVLIAAVRAAVVEVHVPREEIVARIGRRRPIPVTLRIRKHRVDAWIETTIVGSSHETEIKAR